jgi:hypothetical protein
MASSELVFYTYKYVWEDGTPYYIGKGQKNRAFQNHGDIPVPKDKSRIIFLIENVAEKEALEYEKEMIKFYGRKDLGTGPLLNRTNGGQGISGCTTNAAKGRRGFFNLYPKLGKTTTFRIPESFEDFIKEMCSLLDELENVNPGASKKAQEAFIKYLKKSIPETKQYKYQPKYKNLGKTKVMRVPEKTYNKIEKIIEYLDIVAEKESVDKYY